MFDVVFGFMEAWNLAGMLLMGAVFLLIGGGMVGYELYWRTRAQSIKGRISAVRMVSAKAYKKYLSEEEDVDDGQESSGGGVLAGFFIVLMFVGLPLVFSGIGGYMGYKYLSLTSSGTYADAVVVRNEESYDSDSGTSYNAILEFRDVDGRRWEVRDSISYGSSPSYSRGTRIGVYYDEDDPEYFVIDDFWHHMSIALIFFCFGFAFIGFVGLIAYLNKRQQGGTVKKAGADGKPNFSGEMYYPVFEYQAPNGERMEKVGSVGRNSLMGILPGKEVRLLMFPENPEKVRRPLTFLLVFGLIFLLPGLFITYQAFASFHGSFGALLMLLAIVGFVGWRIRTAIEKAPAGAIKEAWKAFKEQKAAGKGFSVEMSSWKQNSKNMVELAQSDIDARVKKQAGQAFIVGYVVLLIAVGLSVGSYYAGLDMLEMTLNGQRAQGQVVDINSRSDSESGYTYYAVVAFEDARGKRMRFEDSVGSSHPMYHQGDEVIVLYDPEKSNDAIIDRGIMNWGLSGGLALGALIMLLLGLNALRQGRANSGLKYRTRI